jgi:hypothetical protein
MRIALALFWTAFLAFGVVRLSRRGESKLTKAKPPIAILVGACRSADKRAREAHLTSNIAMPMNWRIRRSVSFRQACAEVRQTGFLLNQVA